jgi:hypothetical protein
MAAIMSCFDIRVGGREVKRRTERDERSLGATLENASEIVLAEAVFAMSLKNGWRKA